MIWIASGEGVLHQWDRGVVLLISGTCSVVRVSREDDGRARELTPTKTGSIYRVTVPDGMLTESGYLRTACVVRDTDGERVTETARFVIRAAQKPNDYVHGAGEAAGWGTLKMRMDALERAARNGKFNGMPGKPGDNGITPHIGENGNWYIGEEDTGVAAEGADGITPHIGENGNWYIGDQDTGVKAGNADVIAYANDLFTSGVLMTDDMESFVMTGGTSDTGTPRIVTGPGVVYINGVRRDLKKSTRTFFVPNEERVSAQLLRLDKTTGEIGYAIWRDVSINGDIADGGEIVDIETGDILPHRSNADVYYDVILCIVTLPAGSTEVTPDMITDLRGDDQYCGYVSSKIGGGYGGIVKETDPTVPAWAKAATKPAYSKSEVGLGNVANERQYSATNPPPYPVTSVNGKTGAVQLDAEDVGAASKETVDKLSEEVDGKQPSGDYALRNELPKSTSDLNNDSGYITIAVATLLNYYLKTETYAKGETYSQTEVDNLISGLDARLNAIADSDDTTLDQLSEIVAYIKSNKSLIDSVTTSKVNVSDIIDNLTTAESKKPLSAAQGKVLKEMYDALPTWAKAASKPTYTKSEVGLGNVANERQYSANNPPPYPVKSVNGKTGAVETPKAFYITVTDGGNGNYTVDKTADEIKAAYNDKYTLFAKLGNVIMPLRSVLINPTPIGDEWEIIFEAEEKTTQGFIHSFKSTWIRLYGMSTFSVSVSVTDRTTFTQQAVLNMIPTELPASDVYDWAKAASKPTYTKSEVGLGNVDNVKQYSATNPPPYPVTSVNGKTGAVKLDASNVGARPSTWTPTASDVGAPTTEQFKTLSDNVGKIPRTATVQMYGAKGDGTTDDTAAFQAALAAERVVFVPGGTYVLSDTLTVGTNSCLELSQDTVLNFTQTNKNCITMLRLANLKGNHATIFVPYEFSANVINCDGRDDTEQLDSSDYITSNATAVPPFTKWDPQWRMSRYVTDINICKRDYRNNLYSVDGTCSGAAIYLHLDEDDFIHYMWGVDMSGVRIAGAFTYGIRVVNVGDATKTVWNHDMRIEAFMDACKIGLSVDNCNFCRFAIVFQPRRALLTDDTTYIPYAERGIELTNCRHIDLTGCRVWDWNAINTLWSSGNDKQHLVLIGDCTGLILDDFIYYEESGDIRDRIYTDTPSNFETMTILQEPITRWFKPVDGEPYFTDGKNQIKLAKQSEVDQLSANFITDTIPTFINQLAIAVGEDGKTVYNGIGYKNGTAINVKHPASDFDYAYTSVTGFIPCKVGSRIRTENFTYANHGVGNTRVVFYDSNRESIEIGGGYALTVAADDLVGNTGGGNNYTKNYVATDNGFEVTIGDNHYTQNVAYVRFVVNKNDIGENPVITVDEEIEYIADGFLADGIKVKAENVVGGGGGTGGASGGGTSIDVTAEVGQTIVVKEVDATGKPTKWESADYQPRTHYEKLITLVPESTVEYNTEGGMYLTATTEPLVGNADYLINFNGTEWKLTCNLIVNEEGSGTYIGSIQFPPEDGMPPFGVIDGSIFGMDGYLMIMAESEMTDPITLSVTRVEYVQIPKQYIADHLPFYVEATQGEDGMITSFITVTELESAYKSGRQIIVRYVMNEYSTIYLPLAQKFGKVDGNMQFTFAVAMEEFIASANENGTYTFTYKDSSTEATT